MKELNPIQKDKLEVSVVKPIQKQIKKLGTLRLQKGHTCYELNLKTGEVKEAEYDTTAVSFVAASKGDTSIKRKLITKEHHIYATALNKKNAFKKFKKILFPQ